MLGIEVGGAGGGDEGGHCCGRDQREGGGIEAGVGGGCGFVPMKKKKIRISSELILNMPLTF